MNRLSKTIPIILIIILVGTTILHGSLISERVNDEFIPLVDDAYYYFGIGQNIAEGNGPTFDGEHFTNGYHPLWMGVVVLIYKLFPESLTTPIIILQIIGLLLFLGTLILFWLLLNKITDNKWLIYTILVLYILNPFNMAFPTDVLETSLAVFFLTLFLWYLVRLIESPEKLSLYAILALVGGFMVLARNDYGLFVLAAFIYILVTQRTKLLQKSLVFLAIFSVIISPWFLYNVYNFESVFPTSGLAYTTINHEIFLRTPRSETRIFFWGAYQFSKTVTALLTYIGIPLPPYNRDPIQQLFENFIYLAVLILFIWLIKKKERLPDLKNSFLKNPLGKALMVIGIAFLIFTFIHSAIRWGSRPWYYSSLPLLSALAITLILENVFQFQNWSKRMIYITTLSVIILLSAHYSIYSKQLSFYLMPSKQPLPNFIAAQWINENLPNARIASFNSGILGYYTKPFVMNSDGLVNAEVYSVMKNKTRLWDYFKENNIEYIVDSEVSLTWRYNWLIGLENPLENLEVVKSFTPSSGGRSTNVYKIISY
jgi:hypothetical protein